MDNTVNIGLHYVLQHLDRPGAYVRILFVDFRSAFNTIIPDLLLPKLTQLSVPTSICQWINSFLTDRQQLVSLGKYTSSTRHLPGPEVGQSYRLHCEKGPAEAVLPSPAEEVQPATGAADTVLLCHH